MRNAVVARARAHERMRDEPAQERQVRRHAADLGLAQRRGELVVAPPRASSRTRSASRSSGRTTSRSRRPPRRPRRRGCREAAAAARSSPPAAGTCADPRRRAAPRPRARASCSLLLASRRARCAAARVRGRRRSTSSVTGCSTWMRALSSRKKNSRPVEHELGRAGALVADRARERDGGVAHRARATRGRAPATATPRAPSGGAAGSSSRARRARRTVPCVSASSWIST